MHEIGSVVHMVQERLLKWSYFLSIHPNLIAWKWKGEAS